MTTTTLATYENGVLRPVQPLPFTEGEAVQVVISRAEAPAPSPATSEPERSMPAAKSLQALFAAWDAYVEPDDGYDLFKALDEHRKGGRLLFPPELKGISW